jgi:hypothetical protein
VADLNSDYSSPKASIHCYLLEVTISKTRSTIGRLFLDVDLRFFMALSSLFEGQKTLINGPKMREIEKISTCSFKRMFTRRDSILRD